MYIDIDKHSIRDEIWAVIFFFFLFFFFFFFFVGVCVGGGRGGGVIYIYFKTVMTLDRRQNCDFVTCIYLENKLMGFDQIHTHVDMDKTYLAWN